MLAALPHPAIARQQVPVPTDGRQLIQQATQCRAIRSDTERLACYDKAVSAIETARDAGEITILDRARVRATNRSLFGFTLPKLNLFGDDGDDARAEVDVVREIESTIKGAGRAGPSLYVVQLEDGSQWRLTEASKFPPRAGDAIRITRGAMGGYMASIAKQRALRIVRDR